MIVMTVTMLVAMTKMMTIATMMRFEVDEVPARWWSIDHREKDEDHDHDHDDLDCDDSNNNGDDDNDNGDDDDRDDNGPVQPEWQRQELLSQVPWEPQSRLHSAANIMMI